MEWVISVNGSVRQTTPRRRILLYLTIALLAACGALGTYLFVRRHAGLPSPGTDEYRANDNVAILQGTCELQVGLIDAATQDLTQPPCQVRPRRACHSGPIRVLVESAMSPAAHWRGGLGPRGQGKCAQRSGLGHEVHR